MVQRFNDHYKKNFEHCQKVTVDELILWGWTRDQLGGGHKVDTEPRGFGPEYKYLYAVGVQVTTIFEHMRRKEVNNKSKYTKEYGSDAASVLRLDGAAMSIHLARHYYHLTLPISKQRPDLGFPRDGVSKKDKNLIKT